MKKQYINVSAVLSFVFVMGILLGNIIASRIQENKVSIELETQTESMMYLNKPLPVKHFLYEGAIITNDGEFINIILNEDITHTNKENNIVTNKPSIKVESTTEHIIETTQTNESSSTDNEETSVTIEETTKIEPIINADSYRCSLDDIYYTHPVREYTEEQKELIAKMLFCEANITGWDCQVVTCSAIINFIEHYGGDFSVLDNVYKFEPAPYYRYKTPSKMNWQVVDYVLSGHLIADVKYFQLYGYHNFGTPMFKIDGVYFSK